MAVSAVLILYYAYQIEENFVTLARFQISGFTGMIFAAFASFLFAVDSFRRINKYMEDHDDLGITRKQIILNMVVSFLTTMSILALMGSVIAADTRHVSGVL